MALFCDTPTMAIDLGGNFSPKLRSGFTDSSTSWHRRTQAFDSTITLASAATAPFW
jgi:hypothetical protein